MSNYCLLRINFKTKSEEEMSELKNYLVTNYDEFYDSNFIMINDTHLSVELQPTIEERYEIISNDKYLKNNDISIWGFVESYKRLYETFEMKDYEFITETYDENNKLDLIRFYTNCKYNTIDIMEILFEDFCVIPINEMNSVIHLCNYINMEKEINNIKNKNYTNYSLLAKLMIDESLIDLSKEDLNHIIDITSDTDLKLLIREQDCLLLKNISIKDLTSNNTIRISNTVKESISEIRGNYVYVLNQINYYLKALEGFKSLEEIKEDMYEIYELTNYHDVILLCDEKYFNKIMLMEKKLKGVE